jgi:Thymidylate kinase
MGKLIAVEGLDGSGKGTQTKLLVDALEEMGISVLRVSFPNYDSQSAALVKMYLNGEIGASAGDVNAYAASTFYAADRYINYRTQWKQDYAGGKLIVADRYVTSNMVFQMTKLPKEQWDEYIKWLEDFEYEKLEIPKPDMVFYFDMPIEISQELISKRYQGDEAKKDIHEKNISFLRECRESAAYAAEKRGWKVIHCGENGGPRTIESIHDEVIKAVLAAIDS